MKIETSMLKRKMKTKHREKIEHLKKEFRKEELEEVPIPEAIVRFKDLGIFNKNYRDPEKEIVPDIPVIGEEIILDEDEKAALRLAPKTAILDKLNVEEIKVELAMCSTKLRWEIRKESDEKLDDDEEKPTEEEKDHYDELEAEARQPFNPVKKSLDMRCRKVTDLKENSKIYLPKPLEIKEEAKISIRQERFEKIAKDYIEEKCTEKGEQETNLTQSQKRGISKINKRVKNKELVIMLTDKSGKLAVTTMENYIEMGRVHTENDIEICEKDVEETEKTVNGHVSMWLKIGGFGENWRHESRMRESTIQHSKTVSSVYFLLKDHKKVAPGKLPQTRPVVSGFAGIGVSLSNILSEFVEAVANSQTDAFEVISTEDFLYRVNQTNKELERAWSRNKNLVGEREEDEIVLIGADVVGLFPNLLAEQTGRLVAKATRESDIKFEGINYKEVARYVRFGMEDFEIRANGLEKIVPKRRFKPGVTPGITGKEPLSKHSNDEIRWVFSMRDPTEKEKRNLIAAALEIGVRTSFTNHIYQFGGKKYRQARGGPIGLRITMAAARLVMGEWGRSMTKIMLDAGLKIWLRASYVDDVRTGTSVLAKGKRWLEKEKRFEFREEWKDEDEELGESDTRRMSTQMRKAMDSIFPNLKFEMEIEEDFVGKVLPTLDFSLHVERGNDGRRNLRYEFYEKEMNSKYCILERSAMPEQSKISSLTQDLIRRMINTDEKVEQPKRNEIVEVFIEKLRSSGYKKCQVREIVQCGLKGYTTKIENAAREGRDLHRGAASTLASRQRKKLLEKTTWYKTSKKENGRQETNKRNRKEGEKAKERGEKIEIRSVLFVPRTRRGELAARLRKEEEEISRLTGYKVKIVERSGMKVQGILHNSNPWADELCEREDCPICVREGGGQCKKRNIVYKTTCLACKEKGKEASYYGETARSGYERGNEHWEDYEKLDKESHMLKHHVLAHADKPDKLDFSMKIVRGHRSAFRRQVHEAILIELHEKEGIMNSKGGFNRCKLPRLSIMMGKSEIKEKGEIEKEIGEMEIEAEILKLRNRKRLKTMEEEEKCDKEEEDHKGPRRKRRRKWRIEIASSSKRKREGTISNGNKKTKIRKENILASLVETDLAQAGVVCDNEAGKEEADTGKEGRLHNFTESNISKGDMKKLFENLPKNSTYQEGNYSSSAQKSTKLFKIFQFTATQQGGKDRNQAKNLNLAQPKLTQRKPKHNTVQSCIKKRRQKFGTVSNLPYSHRPITEYFGAKTIADRLGKQRTEKSAEISDFNFNSDESIKGLQ